MNINFKSDQDYIKNRVTAKIFYKYFRLDDRNKFSYFDLVSYPKINRQFK
jgi:hypothetical protein